MQTLTLTLQEARSIHWRSVLRDHAAPRPRATTVVGAWAEADRVTAAEAIALESRDPDAPHVSDDKDLMALRRLGRELEQHAEALQLAEVGLPRNFTAQADAELASLRRCREEEARRRLPRRQRQPAPIVQRLGCGARARQSRGRSSRVRGSRRTTSRSAGGGSGGSDGDGPSGEPARGRHPRTCGAVR